MNQFKNRAIRYMAVVLACLMVLSVPLPVLAASGRMIIALNSSSFSVGDKVAVVVTGKNAEGNTTATEMKLTFNDSVLSYDSSNASSASCSGSTVTATGQSVTFYFIAKADGTANFVASGSADGVSFEAAGARVSVSGGQDESEQSQEEKPEETTGTDQVDDAEGVEETEEVVFTIEGRDYVVSSDYSMELPNLGFEETELTISDKTVVGLKYPDSDLTVLYLVAKDDDTVNGYYLYDEENDVLCPYLGYQLGEEKESADPEELTELQSKYNDLNNSYNELKSIDKILKILCIALGALILIIFVNLIIFKVLGRKHDEDYEDYDYEEEEGAALDLKENDYLEKAISNNAGCDLNLADEVANMMKNESLQEHEKALDEAMERAMNTSAQKPANDVANNMKQSVTKAAQPEVDDGDGDFEIIDLEDL